MPKETFLNLSEEKKKKITDAAFCLLEEYKFEEISISRFIKKAEIPRGSFYQYFDGLDDLVMYMFSGIRHELGTEVANELVSNKENIEELLVNVFDNLISFGTNKRNIKVFSNAFSSAEIVERFIKDTAEDQKILIDETKKHLKKDALRIKTDEEVDVLIGLGLSAFKDSIADCFINRETREKAIWKFKIKLDIITRGAFLKESIS